MSSKNKVFIDPSLARGLANGAVRSAIERDDELLRKVKTDNATGVMPRGRAAAFRHGVDLERRKALSAIVLDQPIGRALGKKSDQHLLAIWDALDTKSGLGLGMLWLRSRDFSAVDYAPMLISRHACERIFQRLESTDVRVLEGELRSSTKLAIRLWAAMTRSDVERMLRLDRGVLLPTRHGALIVKRDDKMAVKPHLIATTWVSTDQLRPEQTQDLDALVEGFLQCRDGEDHVIGRLAIPMENWAEITAMMEAYGRTQSMRF